VFIRVHPRVNPRWAEINIFNISKTGASAPAFWNAKTNDDLESLGNSRSDITQQS